MDGTLVDSRELHWRSWQEALAADGVPVTEAQFLATFGQRNDAILCGWLGAGASAERIARIGDAKEAAYRRLVAEGGLAPLPGAAGWLRRLGEAGWRQAIASSAPRLNVEVVLRALELERWFAALVSAEDVSVGKPAPDVFLAAAARLGVPPARCVVVEDAEAGIEAARRAGMRSVGVGGDALGAADIRVASLADLPPDAFDRLVPAP
jgi:beta-phosphoglucomutase